MEEPECETPPVDQHAIPRLENERQGNGQIDGTHIPVPLELSEKQKANIFVDFFDPTAAIQMGRIFTRKRENRGRAIIILMFTLLCVSFGPFCGEGQNEYHFVRNQLNWDNVEYTYFSIYKSALNLLSMLILITGVKMWLELSDTFIGIICCGLAIIARSLYVSTEH